DGDMTITFDEFLKYMSAQAAAAAAAARRRKSVNGVKQEFAKLDANGDGVLSLQEMTVLLKKGNPELSDKDIETLFRRLDKDGSGLLAYSEFVDFIFSRSLAEAPWSSEVPVPQAYRNRTVTLDKAELCGIRVQQVWELAELVQQVVQKGLILDQKNRPLTENSVNMHDVVLHFVKPLTMRFLCAFVEVLATGAQTPKWFASHWWGTPFRQTARLLQFHAAQRQVPDGAYYWIDAFANRQHNSLAISKQLQQNPLQEAPFAKVLLSPQCQGTVTLV
ncbi:unnamed protein product, partial [Polarella glacialis]